MKPRYQRWIDANVPARPGGTCRIVSAAMAREFEELSAVEGVVRYLQQCPDRERYAVQRTTSHSWCVTESGQIVDPTAEQFEAIGSLSYVPNGPLPEAGDSAETIAARLAWARGVWGTREQSNHAEAKA